MLATESGGTVMLSPFCVRRTSGRNAQHVIVSFLMRGPTARSPRGGRIADVAAGVDADRALNLVARCVREAGGQPVDHRRGEQCLEAVHRTGQGNKLAAGGHHGQAVAPGMARDGAGQQRNRVIDCAWRGHCAPRNRVGARQVAS